MEVAFTRPHGYSVKADRRKPACHRQAEIDHAALGFGADLPRKPNHPRVFPSRLSAPAFGVCVAPPVTVSLAISASVPPGLMAAFGSSATDVLGAVARFADADLTAACYQTSAALLQASGHRAFAAAIDNPELGAQWKAVA
ncbi:hypothetical protein [Novosphingobium gossypii]|uniref:hypothetical protein n=1 Tax=Novosphingobium gossypii TaxID=1604774 RepID=UPI003D24E441